MELQAGIRNLFNYRYWDPAGTVQALNSIQQDGRSFFVRLSWAPQRNKDKVSKTGAAGQPGKAP